MKQKSKVRTIRKHDCFSDMEYGAVPYDLMESRMNSLETTAEIHNQPANPPPSPSSDIEKSGVRLKI